MKLHLLKKEILAKRMTRNKKKWLEQSESVVEENIQTSEMIFGTSSSYYSAKAYVGKGDLALEQKEGKEAEKFYLKS